MSATSKVKIAKWLSEGDVAETESRDVAMPYNGSELGDVG